EKYDHLISGEIDNEEYSEHLTYYDKEKQRIEEIITEEQAQLETDDPKPDREKFTQETFENFFGVKLTVGSDDVTTQISENSSDTTSTHETQDPLGITANPTQRVVTNIPTDGNSKNIQQESMLSYKGEQVKDKADLKSYTKQDIEFSEQVLSANILLIGDSMVGRTSIRRAWMGKHFISNHLTTIGASIDKKTISLDGWTINVTLTDLGGQDFYSELRKNFYRNIDGAVIVFDLTKPDSFRRIDYWVKEFYRESKRLVPFILVGNKYDLPNRVIPKDKGVILSEKFSKMTMPNFKVRYLESSAKSGKQVNEVFDTICREIKSFKIQKRRKIKK
ncbi:MAG: Rab family GTPase, partial [Candidatus Heimdallarchaeota archaeon]